MKLVKENKLIHCAAVFLAVTLSYILWRIISPENTAGIRIAMAALVTVSGIYDLWCLKNGKADTKEIVKSIIFAGIVMRIGYMLYTNCAVRSHDLWEFSTDGYGHAGYILTIIQDKMLPQSNLRQYYQQPFFYIVCALVSSPVNAVLTSSDPEMLVDAGKIVSCASSCFVLMMVPSLCDEAELKNGWKTAAAAFTAFCPAFFLSERITPDMLVTMLMTVALLYTLRWYRTPDWKNTVILAAVYGLAVMTKLSAGAAAIFTACVFILKFIGAVREGKFSGLIVKFLVFGVISLPAGLWYSVRNFRKFDQKFGYVLEIPKDHELYTGDHSLFQRVIIPDIPNIFKTPYADVWEDYNLWTYMLKSSLFGEFKFEVPAFVPILLLFSALALCIPLTAGVVKGAFRFKDCRNQFFLSAACVIFMISIVSFVLKYPHGCSMDFRYMTFIVAPSAVLAGRYCSDSGKQWMKTLMASGVIVYAVFSCAMYTLIK